MILVLIQEFNVNSFIIQTPPNIMEFMMITIINLGPHRKWSEISL